MEKPEKSILKWKQCDVSKLVRHFHRFDDQSQYERLGAVHLTKESIEDLFPMDESGIPSKIQSLDISLGVSKRNSPIEKFTFQPYVTVTFKNEKPQISRPFEPAEGEDPLHTQEVPFEFKDQLCKNWQELDINVMDDVFKSNQQEEVPWPDGTKSTRSIPKRLLGYHFTEEINKALLKIINNRSSQIERFIFYLGVDMNKFSAKDAFSFSPIFGLRFAEQLTLEKKHAFAYTVHQQGLRSFETKDGGDLVYLEYVTPCPSTCPLN